jgi:hypothetical protein
MKISKEIKEKGKVSFDGPKVKERKHFAPPTKTDKPKKGKGSYDRKNAFGEDEEGEDCWDGYKKKGTKKKSGKTVNNCVKESTEVQSFIDCVIEKEHSKAFDHLKKIVELKLAALIEKEIDKPLF